MAFNYIVDAIQLLDPEAEFVIEGNDYSTIQWHKVTDNTPTESEINAAIELVKAKEITDKTTKAANKAALLSRLGITAEEATLLLS